MIDYSHNFTGPIDQPDGQVDLDLSKFYQPVFSEIQTYEEEYKLCYIRGPEGIILDLVEEMNRNKLCRRYS